MADIVLPRLAEEPPIIETGHHTWHIENWRASARRERGPVFNVGGYPW